ncbi:MAG: rRNA maturation RNase YbeY [Candidatus Nanopelagicales bacterium]
MAVVDVDNRSTVAVDEDALVEQAQFLLGRLGLHPEAELCISLVDAGEIADLNVTWMDEPGPTDVLSFPMDELRVPGPGEPGEPGVLGDVVICPQVAAAQAESAGHGTPQELELLLTHGILHLLGHDHAEPEEHAVMFGLQDALLAEWRSRS